MLFKPCDQVPGGGELLVMEVEAWAAYLDQFANGITFFEHVDEKDELGVILWDTEVIIDVAAILFGLTTGLVLDGIDRQV